MSERHVIVEFNALPGQEEALRAGLLQYIEPARAEDGCLYYDLYESREVPGCFYILDGWRDAPAFEAHIASVNVKRVRELVRPLLAEPARIKHNQRVSA